MDQLKVMKEQLIAQVQAQMGKIAEVDAKELGEAIDMIKDLAEATYYCTITEAMEKSEKEQKEMKQPVYYTEYRPYEYQRDMDMDKMYYSGGNSRPSQGTTARYMPEESRYYSTSYPMTVRDYREGRSPMSRKMYMESKEMHKDKTTQMAELENYMKELSTDLSEIINSATPEEKQILKQKMTTLINKINV